MITITARFNISENGVTINSVTSNMDGINVSADINDIIGKKSVKIDNNLFILNSSKLDSGATYADNLPYFIGRELSNDNGDFVRPYTFTISGNAISEFIIEFDKENNAYPKSIIVDGETIYDDDPIWQINVTSADTHTITINNWNKSNSSLIITNIYSDIDIEIDKNNLISFNSTVVDRANLQYPSYGVVANSANLTILDFDEQVLDLITQQILHSGIKVSVFLNNTYSGASEQVCVMEIRELTYDNDSRQVQVSLKDNLEELQEISVSAISYDPINGESKTAKWFYEYLYNKTPREYNFQTYDELDENVQNRLSRTTIQYPLLEESTLWDAWQKLCELCLLHIYTDHEGKTVCKYNNGN